MSRSKEEIQYVNPSTWWRFTRYEIREGSICPGRGSDLRSYDPWASYWEEGSAVQSPPYAELGKVIRQLPVDQKLPTAGKEPEALVDAVLAWCRKFGLLGLLPHNTLLASLDPWIVSRAASGWKRSYHPWEPEEGPKEFTIESEIGDAPWLGDIVSGWWDYFPEVDSQEVMNDFRLVPLSDEFWCDYCEPLHWFLKEARYFDNAVRAASGEEVEDLDVYPVEVLDTEKAIKRLNDIAHGVTPVATRNSRGRISREWQSPSLLGHLAMQAVQDLIGGYIRRCHCGNTFSSRNPKRKHCSDRCGTLFRVRKHRTKSKK